MSAISEYVNTWRLAATTNVGNEISGSEEAPRVTNAPQEGQGGQLGHRVARQRRACCCAGGSPAVVLTTVRFAEPMLDAAVFVA
jgi:hypothetical protein